MRRASIPHSTSDMVLRPAFSVNPYERCNIPLQLLFIIDTLHTERNTIKLPKYIMHKNYTSQLPRTQPQHIRRPGPTSSSLRRAHTTAPPASPQFCCCRAFITTVEHCVHLSKCSHPDNLQWHHKTLLSRVLSASLRELPVTDRTLNLEVLRITSLDEINHLWSSILKLV